MPHVINVIIKKRISGLPRQELEMKQKLSSIDVLSVSILGESIDRASKQSKDYLQRFKSIILLTK
jgi:hypothetical protein